MQEGQKLIPSVTRVFSKSRDMYVYLQAYEPGVTSRPAAGGFREPSIGVNPRFWKLRRARSPKGSAIA